MSFKLYHKPAVNIKVGPTCEKCHYPYRDNDGSHDVLQTIHCTITDTCVGTWRTNGYPGEWFEIPDDCRLEDYEV